MKVRLVPGLDHEYPTLGGVRTYGLMLRRFMGDLCELVLDEQDADLVHTQSSYLAERVNVYTCHGGFVPDRIPAVDRNLERATAIISVAQWIVDKYFSQFAWKTIVIPNGVPLGIWDAARKCRNALGLKRKYVLLKGYNTRPRHWALVAEVAKQLPQIRFVSLGRPPGSVTPTARNFTVVAPVEPELMAGMLNDCSMYLSCSSEVNPIIIFEAWACSKPVVALNIDGHSETLGPHDGRAGLLYEDGEGLVRAILECLRNGVQYGQAGRAIVEETHDWKKLADRTYQVYQHVLQKAWPVSKTEAPQDAGPVHS